MASAAWRMPCRRPGCRALQPPCGKSPDRASRLPVLKNRPEEHRTSGFLGAVRFLRIHGRQRFRRCPYLPTCTAMRCFGADGAFFCRRPHRRAARAIFLPEKRPPKSGRRFARSLRQAYIPPGSGRLRRSQTPPGSSCRATPAAVYRLHQTEWAATHRRHGRYPACGCQTPGFRR